MIQRSGSRLDFISVEITVSGIWVVMRGRVGINTCLERRRRNIQKKHSIFKGKYLKVFTKHFIFIHSKNQMT